jgi:predicted outer membrane protein
MKELPIFIEKIKTLDYLVENDAATFCQNFNRSYDKIIERLNKSQQAFATGKISGAVKIAEQLPPLLELVELLLKCDFSHYSEFCATNSFVCPTFMTREQLEKFINNYYCIDTLPALKAYYKKILLSKNLFMQLTLLRRLIKLDPQKSGWINNIKPIEKHYLKISLTKIKTLVAAKDFHELSIVRNELLDNKWHVTLPDNFHNAIEQKYLTLKNSFYQQRAVMAIASLQAEFDPTYPLEYAGRIRAIETFLAETDYRPDAKYSELKSRIETAVTTYEKQQQFDLVADELRLLLEQPDCDKVLLEATLERLKRFEMPIPDRLDIRTANKITGMELFKQRKHRFKQLLLLLGIVIIIVLIGGSLFFFQRNKQCNAICAEINKLVKSGNYTQARAFYDKSLKATPFISKYSQLIKARTNLDEAIRQKYELDRQFRLVKKELNKVRDNKFSISPKQLKQLEHKASKYADDELEKIFIKRFDLDYETVMNHRHQAVINAFNLIISDVSNRLRDYKMWENLSPKQRIGELKSVRDKLLTGEKYIAALSADNRLRYNEYKVEINERIIKAQQQQAVVNNAAKSFEQLIVAPPGSLSLFVNAIRIIHENVRYDRRYRELLHYSELLEELQTVYGQGDMATQENVDEKWQSWHSDYRTWQTLLNYKAKTQLLEFLNSYPIKSLAGIGVRRKLSNEKEQWYFLSSPEYNQHWGKYNVTLYHSDEAGKIVPTKRSYRKTEYYVKIDKDVYHTKYANDISWLQDATKGSSLSLLFYEKYLKPVCQDYKVPVPVKLLTIKAFIASLPVKQLFTEELKPFSQLMATDIATDWLGSEVDIGAERRQQIKNKYQQLYSKTMLPDLAIMVNRYRKIIAMYRWAVSPYFILSGIVDYGEVNPTRKNVKYLFALGYRKVEDKNSYYPKFIFIKRRDMYRKVVTEEELFNGMPLLGLRMENDFEKYIKFSKQSGIVPMLFKSLQGK